MSWFRPEIIVIQENDKEEVRLLKHIVNELRAIRHELRPHPPLTRHVAVLFSGAEMANSVVLLVGQTSQATLAEFLADGTSPSGGVPSNVSFVFSDPSATVVLNADGISATVVGVAASAGAIDGTALFTVTDTDGAVSTWKQGFTIEVDPVAPPPAQLTQSVAVNFSTPA